MYFNNNSVYEQKNGTQQENQECACSIEISESGDNLHNGFCNFRVTVKKKCSSLFSDLKNQPKIYNPSF